MGLVASKPNCALNLPPNYTTISVVANFGDNPALPGDKDYSVSTEATQTHPPKFSTQ